ncbi:MAG: spondin domain-containing protein [Acidobacteriales bacterium]|nr:spondin domain-containing protein [Terriglobales bacterium]
MLSRHASLLITGLVAALFCAASVAAQEGPRFEVTITNLTRGQVFTPIFAASHKAGVSFFMAGQPSSVALEILAEGGDTVPIKAEFSANPKVKDVVDSGAPLPPGRSVTLVLKTGGGFDHISLGAMLVPTNDGFFALNGVAGPLGNHTIVLFSPAYDAGGEDNDELCGHIPGPPTVCSGEGFNPSRAGDVNFVHIHAGIHGVGDLNAATYDWRNPVARIAIRRLTGSN